MPSCREYYFAHLACLCSGQAVHEQVIYHRSFLRFHTQLVERAKRMAKRFRALYGAELRLGCLPAFLSGLDGGEQSIVDELTRNGRREDEVLWQVINYRMYRQIQAIAKGKGTVEGIHSWVGPFNSFMQCGKPDQGEQRNLRIYCADGEGFAPYFLERITACVAAEKEGFLTFKAEATEIARFLETRRQGAPFDEPSFDRFLTWVDLYKSMIEQELEE